MYQRWLRASSAVRRREGSSWSRPLSSANPSGESALRPSCTVPGSGNRSRSRFRGCGRKLYCAPHNCTLPSAAAALNTTTVVHTFKGKPVLRLRQDVVLRAPLSKQNISTTSLRESRFRGCGRKLYCAPHEPTSLSSQPFTSSREVGSPAAAGSCTTRPQEDSQEQLQHRSLTNTTPRESRFSDRLQQGGVLQAHKTCTPTTVEF